MNNKEIKYINIENIIWIIYLFIILFNLYSNYLEKKYINNKDKEALIKFHRINETISFIIIFIYIYFLYISYKGIKDNKNKKLDNLLNINLVVSILFFIGGLLSFYTVKNIDTINEQIAII